MMYACEGELEMSQFESDKPSTAGQTVEVQPMYGYFFFTITSLLKYKTF